jgi:hypothetical protein
VNVKNGHVVTSESSLEVTVIQVYFGVVSQDCSDEPDCNLSSRNSGGPGTFSEEVSHLSIRLNKQTF